MAPHKPNFINQFIIIGDYHVFITRSYHFTCVEAKRAILHFL